MSNPASSLGGGFWGLTGALTYIQSFDPIVIYYGAGYRHQFDATFQGGFSVDPGPQSFYRFGAGFAVNPNVTFSASFTGSFISSNRVNGVRVAGSAREPMQVRLAATIARSTKTAAKDTKTKKRRKMKTIEPFVNIGLTEEAVDSQFGLGLTY